MKIHSQNAEASSRFSSRDWRGAPLRTRSFHVEFPEDEDTPITHTASLQRDFVKRDGGLNLEHRFWRSGGYVEFFINDRFHAILSLRWLPLVALVFVTVVILAGLLAVILFLATGAKAQECLGSSDSRWDYFFFVVETMFAIGYGSPRYPSCRMSSFMVTPIVVTGVLVNSLILGLVFQKFSSAARRKWALAFTHKLVVSTGDHHAGAWREAYGNGLAVEENSLSAAAPPHASGDSTLSRPSVGSKRPLHEPLLQAIPEGSGSPQSGEDTHMSPRSLEFDSEEVQEDMRSHLYMAQPSNESVMLRGYEWAGKKQEVPIQTNSDRSGNLRISFRVLNITETSFFNPKLALYLLVHRSRGLLIRQFSMFHTDTPLEFMALPITVTVDQRDVGSPLRDVTEAQLRSHGDRYELLALLSFTDNRTSRTVEVSKSWRLNSAVWNEVFVPIVRQSGPKSSRAFEIDVDNLSTTRVGRLFPFRPEHLLQEPAFV
ncbi:hypothetical protein Esti_005159 [Eimeria stiedai]